MKQMTNVRLTPAPGFLKIIDSSSGEKPLDFFGLRERVSLHSKLFEFRVINNSIAGSGKSILW